MNSDVIYYFSSFLFLAVFIIFIVINLEYYKNNADSEAWSKFAQANGLNFLKEGFPVKIPIVNGIYRNFRYTLSYYKGSCFPFISIETPYIINFNLEIDSKVCLKATSMEEVKTGDTEFDNIFIIKSDYPQKALQIITPEIREKLLEGKKFTNIFFNGSSINFKGYETLRDIQELNYVSDLLWHIASNILQKLPDGRNEKELSDSYYAKQVIIDNSLQNSSLYKKQENVASDFTSNNEEKITCPYCYVKVPSTNKFCINCRRTL